MSETNNKHSDHESQSSADSGDNHTLSRNGELLVRPASANNGSRPPLLQPYPPATSSPDSKAVLSALRRKWFLALSLGLIFGFCGGLTAWFLVPAPYTAYRELHIKSVPEIILFQTAEPDTKFEFYKSTQMRQVKSPMVLNSALGNLSNPRQKELRLIQEIEKTMRPRIWLEEELEVTSPAQEFIRIALSGDKPEGLAEIVNAVTDSYFKEIVDVDKDRRGNKLEQLKTFRDEHDNLLSKKRKDLNRLAKRLNTKDSGTIILKQKEEIEYHGELRKHLIQIKIDLLKAESLIPQVKDPENKQNVTKADPQATDFQDELLNYNKLRIERQIEQRPKFIEEEQRIKRLEASVALYKNVADNNPRLIDLKKQLKTRITGLEKLRKELRVVVADELRNQMEEQSGISDLSLQKKIKTLEGLKQYLENELKNQKLISADGVFQHRDV
jgi:hypothetical protein